MTYTEKIGKIKVHSVNLFNEFSFTKGKAKTEKIYNI